jgi:hypothetical protein
MTNPVELLHLISLVTDRMFLWTHYYDEALIARKPEVQRKLRTSEEANYEGFTHTLHRYDYRTSFGLKRFIGGPNPYACWMERQAILDCLKFFGFGSVVTNFEEPNHSDGPGFALVAWR